MATEFAQIIGPLAQSFFGEPNREMSSAAELRYGSHGSFSVDLRNGTWYDHEVEEGGGVLDLVTRETKLEGAERLDWLKTHGFLYETIQSNGAQQPRPSIIATYDYQDEGGNLLFQVCRFEPKDFRQRRPDGNGGWVWSVKGIKAVPYRLPQVLENDDKVICIVEGEKAADRLWKLGIPASCSPGGAGKWREELNEFFRGADVVIIPDYDPQKKHPKTKEPIFHPDGRPVLPGQDHADCRGQIVVRASRRGCGVLELWKHWEKMPLKGDVYDWISHGGTAEQLYALIDKTQDWSQESNADRVKLLFPFPIKGEEIPRRQWIVPGLLLRRNVTILVAPPGSGKSLLTLQMALMMGTALHWGGWHPRAPCKTLVINAEDDSDEMRRRLWAACQEMRISASDLAERVAIAEAPNTLIIAKADSRTKTVIEQPMAKQLIKTVNENRFDVLVVDPFAETFEGDENSNSELKWAAVLWRKIARETNAAVMLVHHTRKFNAEAGDMDSARGGGALVGVARVVSTLFAMTEEEAAIYNVRDNDRHLYLRFDDAKANLSLVTFAAKWFKKQTVTLPNDGDDEPGDEVGVLEPWLPTSILARVNNQTINDMLDAIALGVPDSDGKPSGDPYTLSRKGRNNKRWAGNAISSLVECTDKEAQDLLAAWVRSGLISEVNSATSTSKGMKRRGLVVNNSLRPGTLISEDKI